MNLKDIADIIDPKVPDIPRIESMMQEANKELFKAMENGGLPEVQKQATILWKAFGILNCVKNTNRELLRAIGAADEKSVELERLILEESLTKMKFMLGTWYPVVYDEVNGYRKVRWDNCCWLVNANGDVIIGADWEYSDLGEVMAGRLLYKKKDWKWWMMNIEWEIIYEYEFPCERLPDLFYNWYASVNLKGKKYWLLDDKWKRVDNVEYDSIIGIKWREWIYKVLDNGCCKMIDKDGNVIYNHKKCDNISDFREVNWKLVAVAEKCGFKRERRWLIGLIDGKFEELTKSKYVILDHERDNIYYYWKGYYLRKDEYWYVDCLTWEEYRWEKKKQLLKKWALEWYVPKMGDKINREF